jgi:hypothetical protein
MQLGPSAGGDLKEMVERQLAVPPRNMFPVMPASEVAYRSQDAQEGPKAFAEKRRSRSKNS